jgi:hypothetical protein
VCLEQPVLRRALGLHAGVREHGLRALRVGVATRNLPAEPFAAQAFRTAAR